MVARRTRNSCQIRSSGQLAMFLVRRALQVEAGQPVRAHGEEGEAALVMAVMSSGDTGGVSASMPSQLKG